jgi:hypothetical protein
MIRSSRDLWKHLAVGADGVQGAPHRSKAVDGRAVIAENQVGVGTRRSHVAFMHRANSGLILVTHGLNGPSPGFDVSRDPAL